ncbi:MAG: hypothetical protein WC477_07785, partial [Patescibacteria group bacterium]
MGRSFAGILATASVISAAIIASITFDIGVGTNLLISDTTTTTTLCIGTDCRNSWPVSGGSQTLEQVIAQGDEATSTPFFYGGLWASNVMSTGTLYASSSVMDRVIWGSATGTNTTSTNLYATRLFWANATGTNLTATTGIFTTLCLTGDDCITTWPTGTGG